MIDISDIEFEGKTAKAVHIQLPAGNLVMISGSKGYIFCGYLNIETSERLGEAAVIITGVRSVNDLLNSKVVKLTSKASELGIKPGMTGSEVLPFII